MGGHIFKDPKGHPSTQKITRQQVVPTVQWLEKLTGLNLTDNMLGSTGVSDISGDIDLGVDSTKVTKEVLINLLLNKGIDRKNITKTGDCVCLRTPIMGDGEAHGYVQTDFIFSDDPAWQHFAVTGGAPNSPYKGMHRHILLSSIAKALNMKWSPKFGLVDRATSEPISKDPKEIAQKLVDGTPNDIKTVESIIKKIKSRPDFERLVADAKETFKREGLELPERSPLPGTGAWFRAWQLKDY